MDKSAGLHYFIKLVNDWKGDYHTDNKGDICFQNKQTMTNIWFTHNSMHKIQPHSRGIDQLPDTVQTPDEIWSFWGDVKTQRIVFRNYIRGSYVVQTRDGVITDAFLVKSTAKYRTGVIINVGK
jgi:hypothetical protein